eukprot:Rhum_TRINITY_DN18794_c0_g1::Rhum_TRINITY_DN18794_c0_g1_i1::g.168428::m.168428
MRATKVCIVASACAAMCWSTSGQEVERRVVDGVTYRVEGDILVREDDVRDGDTLSAVPFAHQGYVWEDGKDIRYFIDTTTSAGSTGPLAAGEPRILEALALISAKTCITFKECKTEAACAKPYNKFVADAESCLSPVGRPRSAPFINNIMLSPGCSRGVVLHEILHSLGLGHEHSRLDRDDYVKVVPSAAPASLSAQFSKIASATGRDVGPYDYNSIMHYGVFDFTTNGQRTIVSPRPIGQRSRLSAGDIATLRFLYNNCAAYTAISCISSRDPGFTHVIAKGRAFTVEFNGLFNADITEEATTGANLVTSRGVGNVDGLRSVRNRVVFTPTAAGKQDISVRYRPTGGAGAWTQTCTVKVEVLDATEVCFGKAGTDPMVCSGNGMCRSTVSQSAPCVCRLGFGGADCSGYDDCPDNYLSSFDSDLGSWTLHNADHDTKFGASGGSLRLGRGSAAGNGKLELVEASKPQRVTFYVARSSSFSVMSLRSQKEECLTVNFQSSVFFVASNQAATRGLVLPPGKFLFVDLRIDWGSHFYDIYLAGNLYKKGVTFRNNCGSMDNMLVSGTNSWYDEVHIWCKDYIVPTGDLTNLRALPVLARSGGGTVTYTVVSPIASRLRAEWINSSESRAAVVSGTLNSWVDSSEAGVKIDGTDVTVGPFRRSFDKAAVVGLDLAGVAKMLTNSARIAAHGPMELAVSLNQPCTLALYSFDDVGEMNANLPESSADATLSTLTKSKGEGSLRITASSVSHILTMMPTWGTYYARSVKFDLLVEGSALFQFKISGGDNKMIVLLFSKARGLGYHTGQSVATGVSVTAADGFNSLGVHFEWENRKLHVEFNRKIVATETIPTGLVVVEQMEVSSTSGTSFLDEVSIGCDQDSVLGALKTTNTSLKSSDDDDDSQTALIVALSVAGAVGLLCLIAAAIFCCCASSKPVAKNEPTYTV